MSINRLQAVETSPNEGYLRFGQKLGGGAFKEVFLGFDTEEGVEVAWNNVNLSPLDERQRERVYRETRFLESLKHPRIIRFRNVWDDRKRDRVVFITERVTSGDLKEYISRVSNVKLKVIKKWCRQILFGLDYLHSHVPPIIHRDIKLDNIFVNGNTGDILIGDLGLCTQVTKPIHSVLGTPQFMAPEQYDENYDEFVDIYAFGMCVLQMVTNEYPYSECTHPAQIWRKVTQGSKPAVLSRVLDPAVREFISICIGPKIERLSAAELLYHPFLQFDRPEDTLHCPIRKSIRELSGCQLPLRSPEKKGAIGNIKDLNKKPVPIPEENETPKPISYVFKVSNIDQADPNILHMLLVMKLPGGKFKNVAFDYELSKDSPLKVAREMCEDPKVSLHPDQAEQVAHDIETRINLFRPPPQKEQKEQSSPKPLVQIPSSQQIQANIQPQQIQAQQIQTVQQTNPTPIPLIPTNISLLNPTPQIQANIQQKQIQPSQQIQANIQPQQIQAQQIQETQQTNPTPVQLIPTNIPLLNPTPQINVPLVHNLVNTSQAVNESIPTRADTPQKTLNPTPQTIHIQLQPTDKPKIEITPTPTPQQQAIIPTNTPSPKSESVLERRISAIEEKLEKLIDIVTTKL